MPAYSKVKHQGRTLDKATLAALRQAEMVLGYTKDSLTVVQGGWNGGRVAASGGTHDGAGPVDLTAQNHREKVAAMRFVGFAAWFRPRLAGVWGDHVHGILWCSKIWRHVPAVAQRQVSDARNGLDGLASHARDRTGAPRLTHEFYYGSQVQLGRMKTFRAARKRAVPGSVNHRQIARVRKALQREGIKLTSPTRSWPEQEWKAFERKVLKRDAPNGIPDPRALIHLGRRHKTFMAQP